MGARRSSDSPRSVSGRRGFLKAAAVAGVSLAGLRAAHAADATAPCWSTDQTNEAIVIAFWAAWAAKDEAAIMSFFDDGATWRNVPVSPAVGRNAIKALVDNFLSIFTAVNIETLTMASFGSSVHTERIDHFNVVNGKVVALPVAGILTFKNGLICQWNDYFDLATFESQSGVKLS
jgi:limonene-1,2-epoxide hydrolase